MLADAIIGDRISILLSTNRTIHGTLNEIKTYGIELKDGEYLRQGNVLVFKEIVSFYPFHNIIKITKFKN